MPEITHFDKVLNLAVEERYSRFPVYENSIDNIIGIIHIKDLLKVNKETFDLNNIMRMPSYVPESQKIDDVFDEMIASYFPELANAVSFPAHSA